MSVESVLGDRRGRRRLETIEEVLDVAADVMAEEGVVGLSLGEVARRMGIKPPSLYVYFPSKHALYDGLFARGAQAFADALEAVSTDGTALEPILLRFADGAVRWAVEHPAYSQLLFWRPVPGFVPSAESYAPAEQTLERGTEVFAGLQARGLVRGDVDPADVLRDWTVLLVGVMTQQLSNAPDEGFARGTFTRRLSTLVSMFAAHYAAPRKRKR